MAKKKIKRKSARARRCSLTLKNSIGLVTIGSTVWECCARKLGGHKIAQCHKMDPKHPALIRLAAHKAAVQAAAAQKAASYEARGSRSYGPGYGLVEGSETARAFLAKKKPYKTPGPGGTRLFGVGGLRRRRRKHVRR
jgi:hypothetical protein